MPHGEPAYSWFWQPPIEGKPGLCMIVDDHPGPDAAGMPFLLEALNDTLLEIETKLPNDISFDQLRVYVRDPFELWCQLKFDALSRRFKIGEPDFKVSELTELWASRDAQAPRLQ